MVRAKRARTKNAPARVFQIKQEKKAGRPQSYISLLYGIGTVIVLFIIVVLGLQFNIRRNQGGILDKPAITGQQAETDNRTYTVKVGDTLWSIAEDQLNSGYRWVEIARVNNLKNPGDIKVGQKLILPEKSLELAQGATLTPTQATETSTPTKSKIQATATPVQTAIKKAPSTGRAEEIAAPATEKITGNTYTVKTGDTLWDISVRAYSDGFKWKEIAESNNLVHPSIIHNGNVLTIPR